MALTALAAWTCDGGPTAVGGPPVAQIASPAGTATFAGGDTIEIQAAATGAQGIVPPSGLSWWVDLHHDTHTHPAQPPTEGASGQFVVPRVGHPDVNVFYRVYVRAEDAQGRADTAFVDVQPRLTVLSLRSVPVGLQVTLDGQPHPTPFVVSTIVGMEREIGAPVSQDLGESRYDFNAWSPQLADGNVMHLAVPEGGIEVTAGYSEAGAANRAPTVQLNAPAIATAGSAVSLAATATDLDGTVERVEFFVDATRVAEVSAPPFEASWTPAATGTRVLRARVTDDDGAYAISEPISVTVRAAGEGDVVAPVATLTSPAAAALLDGAFTITATASDDVGVVQVNFEVDGVPVGSDASPPYEVSVASTAPWTTGVHVVRARAEDAAGNQSDWSASTVSIGGDTDLPAGFTRDVLASGFGAVLTSVAVAPDGRLFVCEKSGRVRVVKDGVLLATPFVEVTTDDAGERGLLGIALHPSFATNGLVYVYYTSPTGGAHNRVSRFVASGDVAVAGSEQVIVQLPTLSESGKHNGGAMHFGPDGKLYVAVGDNTEPSRAPELTSPFGKILRFNPDGTIPPDNPFSSQTTGLQRAIWARGLRNPFTFGFDTLTGRMHVNDVGASAWEEINLGRAGAHYGWPVTEGPTDDPAFDPPLVAYAHPGGGTPVEGYAVVGAAFYRPTIDSFGAEYQGQYFFADYVSGWVNRLDPANDNAVYAFARLTGNPTDLAIGLDGELLVLIDTRIERIRR